MALVLMMERVGAEGEKVGGGGSCLRFLRSGGGGVDIGARGPVE